MNSIIEKPYCIIYVGGFLGKNNVLVIIISYLIYFIIFFYLV